jgi:hypothetical protein
VTEAQKAAQQGSSGPGQLVQCLQSLTPEQQAGASCACSSSSSAWQPAQYAPVQWCTIELGQNARRHGTVQDSSVSGAPCRLYAGRSAAAVVSRA